VDNVKTVFTDEGRVSERNNQCSLENRFCNTLLENISSLLGDHETSDVTISVRNNGVEVRKFFCLSAILSGTQTGIAVFYKYCNCSLTA